MAAHSYHRQNCLQPIFYIRIILCCQFAWAIEQKIDSPVGRASYLRLPTSPVVTMLDLAISETSATNINGQLTFGCIATGLPDIRFRGWETASGRNATGEAVVTADRGATDAVLSARLEVANLTTCEQDGGYVCTFDDGDPFNTARSSLIDCPERKCIQWTPSNPATLGICQSVLIRGVATFSGVNLH